MSEEMLTIEATLRRPDFTLEVSEAIPLSGCTALFGASGSGKSTLLQLISGFLRPDEGQITLTGNCLCDTDKKTFVPPHKRPVGHMFQEGYLFPHLSVEGNLLYADKRSKADDRRYSLDEITSAFDLAPLLHRQPASLSGGERQRVVLARTLLTRPALLLLDEPLSALDKQRKADILPYLDDLSGRFGLPVIYVSHNVEEVVRLAETTLIMDQGRIAASGGTTAILNDYRLKAGFEAEAPVAVMEGRVEHHDTDYHLTYVVIGGNRLSLPLDNAKRPGDTVRLSIEAANVAIATEPVENLSIRNALPAAITAITDDENPAFVLIRMSASGSLLYARITKAAVADLRLEEGQKVIALIKSASFDH